MREKSETITAVDIVTASGHIGYQWDLLKDHITWFGPWRSLFGSGQAAPPSCAQELAQYVLAVDHHLIFNDMPASFERTYRLRSADGVLLHIRESGRTDFEKGRAVRQQGLLRLLEQPEKEAVFHVSADRDPLTGRPNRSCFQSVIDKLLSGPRLTRQNSAYMVVGIDKMAFVNEATGTKIADQLICAAADRLSSLCPTRALIGRVSGDTFGIVLPDLAKDMEILADRILANFHDHAVSAGPMCLHLSVCIGCLPFADAQGDAADIMIHAEQALHEARLIGRGQKVTYFESTRRAEEHRNILDIFERVKQALKANSVLLAFQPVVQAQTGKVVFYEALARLMNDDGSPMPAGDFIPIVEQMGLAPEFDAHVLDLAIACLEKNPNLCLAVNLSGATATREDLPSLMRRKLAGRLNVARRLIIEITETAAVQDIKRICMLIASLYQVGCEVALDDFGAGATSIRHLRDLDLAVMKIDRDLLINLTASEEQQHLVRMLIALAHGLGIKAVAEGIENEETALWLRDEGADYLQGYHIGRPSFDQPQSCAGQLRVKAPLGKESGPLSRKEPPNQEDHAPAL
ncbi:MAG: bifunctional diguanylate cyclase/phosphodiesterase [Alphaproteobacteria bacterium]|nr:bifunctional diguanylate cyclase/phosphodiesterase [Alphaproteobacteria bacterium]